VILTISWWWQKLGRDGQWVNKQGISGIKRGKEYLKYKINELATHSKNEDIRYLYRGRN
jgi:hypothetical protein